MCRSWGGLPLWTKVMRKEARHTQMRDRASGVHPDILEHFPTKKTGVCLLYCFVLSPLISLGAVPHHHLALSVKELTYSSNSYSSLSFFPLIPAESPSGARNPPRLLIMPGLLRPLEKVSRVRHLSLFERAPAAYVSGANFSPGDRERPDRAVAGALPAGDRAAAGRRTPAGRQGALAGGAVPPVQSPDQRAAAAGVHRQRRPEGDERPGGAPDLPAGRRPGGRAGAARPRAQAGVDRAGAGGRWR